MRYLFSLSGMAVFLFTFMHVSNVTLYVQVQRIGFVQWHFWLIGLLLCFALALFSNRLFKVPRKSLSFLLWSGAFLLVCLGSLLVVDRGEFAMEGFMTYIWFFSASVVLVLLVRSTDDIKACGAGVVAGVTLVGVLALMEFIDPDFQVIVDQLFDDKYEVGEVSRVGSLYENPNVAGIAMVLGMFVGQFFLPKAFRILFMIFVGVCVFGTVSRGSLVLWTAAFLISSFFGYLTTSKVFGKIFGLTFVGLLSFLLVSGKIPEITVSLGIDHLFNEGITERLSGNFFTQQDGSTESRTDAAIEGWQLFLANPLTGVGMNGSEDLEVTGISTHNQFIKIAAELGILGILVFLGIAVISLASRSVVPIVFVGLFFLISFTDNTLLSYTAFGVLLPMAVVFIPMLEAEAKAAKAAKKKRRRKKRRRKSANHSYDEA